MENNKYKLGFAGIVDLVTDLSTIPDVEPQVAPCASQESGKPSPENVRHESATTPLPNAINGPSPQLSHFNWKGIVGLVGAGLLMIWIFYSPAKNFQRPPQSDSSSQRIQPAPPSSTPPTAKPSELYYEKPPAGTGNSLSGHQIRWCVREQIRLDAMRGRSASSAKIGYFNTLVDDYNARCSRFKYRKGALEQARRDVESERGRITNEAIQEITSQRQ